MYLGSRAEARPASKTPNRVRAEAASSDAPDSAETARLRRRAPRRPGRRGQHLGRPEDRARRPGLVGLGEIAEAGQQLALGDELHRGAEHGQVAGRARRPPGGRRSRPRPPPRRPRSRRTRTASPGSRRARPARRCRRSARRCRWRRPGRAGPRRGWRPGRPRAATPVTLRHRGRPGHRAVGGQDPGADAHRRGRLEHPQHVDEPCGPAQVVDQGDGGQRRSRPAALILAARASSRSPGQLGARRPAPTTPRPGRRGTDTPAMSGPPTAGP